MYPNYFKVSTNYTKSSGLSRTGYFLIHFPRAAIICLPFVYIFHVSIKNLFLVVNHVNLRVHFVI